LSRQSIFSLQHSYKKLGSFLREKRVAAGLSQVEVARRLGAKNSQFFSNIERGFSPPPFPLLLKMMKLYRIDPTEMTQMLVSLQHDYFSWYFSPKGKKADPIARSPARRRAGARL